MNMYLLSEDQRFFFSLQYHEWMNGTRLQIIVSALLRWLSHLRTVPIAKHGNSTMKAGYSEGSIWSTAYFMILATYKKEAVYNFTSGFILTVRDRISTKKSRKHIIWQLKIYFQLIKQEEVFNFSYQREFWLSQIGYGAKMHTYWLILLQKQIIWTGYMHMCKRRIPLRCNEILQLLQGPPAQEDM